MASAKRTWISVSPLSKQGEASQKQIITTDFANIRAKKINEHGIGSTKITYELKGLWKDIVNYEGVDYESFSMLESGVITDEGSPQIPQEGLFIALPENATFKELKVLNKEEVEIEGKFNILPAPKPVFEGQKIEHIPSKIIYDSDDLFPGKYAEYVGTKFISGRKVVHALVYLLQYKPKSQTITALKSIELEVIYETSPGQDSDVKKKVIKKSHLDDLILGYQIPPDKGVKNAGGSINISRPSNLNLKDPDNAADLVIITKANLIPSFSNYISEKSYSYTIKTVTVDQIVTEFPSTATDISIREFLIYATENWSLPPEVAVLGGNIDIVPTHMQADGGENIPSDHYYADLKGDMAPDIYVCRFPASNPTDMKNICDNLASYSSRTGDWRKDTLQVAYQSSVYTDCKDQISTHIGTTFDNTKLYGGSSTKADVMKSIDDGKGIVNYRGHGSDSGWSSSNGLSSADVPELTNNEMNPQVLSIACLNNKIDMTGNCFGATWILDNKAVSFLGASRPSYTTTNSYFDNYLWDAILDQNLETAGEIFNWATAQLLRNYPSSTTNHNVYMYLLLGDLTANYKGGSMPTQTTVGFVLMMDTSGTMHDATSIVKIDSKAFIREARPNDQFGINQFNNNAYWVYPNNNQIVTISQDLHETSAAAENIESKVQPNPMSYLTNLGQAIQFGNEMIAQATTDVKAFVMLSDGYYNTGPNPVEVLGSTPPIFVAGLGPYLKKEYFDPLLSKNPNSKFYHRPNAWEMMQVYNDIRALPVDVGLTCNDTDQYKGSDYQITSSEISNDSEEAQFVVVWSDKKYKYTSGTPGGDNINVVLIDPAGKTTKIKPDIVDEGFCIFNVNNIQPGTWRTLVQYSVPEQIYGTSGGFQFDTQVNLHLTAPTLHTAGKPLVFTAKLLDGGNPVENLHVRARITQPVISINNALKKYKTKLTGIKPPKKLLEDGFPENYAKLHTLRREFFDREDILGTKSNMLMMNFTKDGTYEGVIKDTSEAGAYTVQISVTGKNPRTGKTFSRTRSFSTLVG